MIRFTSLLGLVVSFAFTAVALSAPAAPTAPVWQSEFETYLDSVVKDYGLPGIAIEVVGVDGPIVQITRGYRDIENQKPVTPQTLYAIGSTSKAFTGVLLAQLRDQGLVDFDQPVQKYWPGFALSDAKASAMVTLHDLASHYTGVGRHDLAWVERPGATRAGFLKLIPLLPMSVEPHKAFIYNNWMLMALGEVEAMVSGKTYEELLQTKLLDPLGMSSSTVSLATMKASSDFAYAYEVDAKFQTKKIPFLDIAPFNAAGGIYSNLDDMAKWVQLHLNEGLAPNGTEIVSKQSLAETHKGYTPIAPTAEYAMGWGVATKDGTTTLTHDGGINGFTANVSLVTEKKMGVVILMNSTPVTPAWIAMRLWQHIRGLPVTDTVKLGRDAAAKAEAAGQTAFPDPVATAKTQEELKPYVGDYCDALYGRATVSMVGDTLHVKVSLIDVDIKPESESSFFIPGVWEAMKSLRFEKKNGTVQFLTWALEPTAPNPVRFERCP